ncbi:putative membrane protein [Escherichia coli 3-373-03_S4_C3]|nr:putative membrane protein [Escherichia coli 3-373-03_S4_C1]KEL20464.1 putative membrane protein [Escherichia coli 3-373-03_S4_C3]
MMIYLHQLFQKYRLVACILLFYFILFYFCLIFSLLFKVGLSIFFIFNPL